MHLRRYDAPYVSALHGAAGTFWQTERCLSTIVDSSSLVNFRAGARGAQFPTGQELDDHSKSPTAISQAERIKLALVPLPCRISSNLTRLFVVYQSEEPRMPQVVIRRQFYKFKLPH
jgi:hypothetical protein